MTNNIRRKGAALFLATLLAAQLFVSTGCYGKFPLTQNVHTLNGSITAVDTIHSVSYWLLTPVYLVAIIVDSFVFNVLEFWLGFTLPAFSEAGAENTDMMLAAMIESTSLPNETMATAPSGGPADR